MQVEAGEALGAGPSHIIKRPRLTRLLDEATARVILLVAPAGYGKTTLAREWLADKPHAWYRGGPGTSDVAALALGLARAAVPLVSDAGDRLRTRLRVSDTTTLKSEPLAELLAEDLRDLADEAWLVFDDYHFACDSGPAEHFVDHLIASCPVRWLILSRSRPTWATTRRLLYGEMRELGRGVLAMSRDEASSVFLSRTAPEIEGLITLADGWPALIGLAATAELNRVPPGGMPDDLFSFFAEELYNATSSEAQSCLRRLALAPRITLDLATFLGGDVAPRVITEATDLGFFLSSTTCPEFHPLLRSFLLAKFIEDRDDDNRELVSGLVELLLDRQDWDDAFELIERFPDNSPLISLFEAALPRMLNESRIPTLARWIETAIARQIDSPVLEVAEAEVALAQGEWRRAEALATQAARRLPPGHPFRSKTHWIAGTSAHLMMRSERALAYFARAAEEAQSRVDRSQTLWGRFTATMKLDRSPEAAGLLDELGKDSANTVDEVLRIASGRLMLCSLLGGLTETLNDVASLSPLVDRARDPLIRSSFLNAHSALLALGGRYQEAYASARLAYEFAVPYGLEFATAYAHFQLAVALLGLRDFRRCQVELRSSERAAVAADDTFLRMNVGVVRGRTQLMLGAAVEAAATFETYVQLTSTASMEGELIAWWSLSAAVSNDSRLAKRLAEHAETLTPRIEVTALVPWTRAIVAANAENNVRRACEHAFRTMLRTGNIDGFVTAYRACPRILETLVTRPDHEHTLKMILEQARDHTLAQQVGLRLLPPPDRDGLAGLSKREREVLDLICQGLTNKEIGRTLFITEGTVKVHTRKICLKLGVRSRTEAAMRASEISG